MKVEQIRPFLMRSWAKFLFFRTGGGYRPVLQFGRSCRIGSQCSIQVGKRSVMRLGNKATLRGGCVFDLAKEGELVLGDQSEIRHYSIIECAGRVSIGNRSVIGAYNWLQGSGEIVIGDDVIIGPGVRVISTTHDVADPDKSFACQPLINKRVQIGNNVWIGANVVILAGVCIGNNVVVGAGALVARDLESGGVYVGAPSRRVKDVRSNR